MDKRYAAKTLIEAVGGLVSEEHILGVLEVFEGVRQGVHNEWEIFLTEQTNNTIMMDKITCESCGTKVVIKRTPGYISTGSV